MNAERPDLEDSLSRLLAADAARHPVEVSPWFATRVAASARSLPHRSHPLWKRWFLPLPLAGLCAMVFLAIHGGGLSSLTGPYHSSDSEFEQHMELLIADLD
jgi:hypothetical protein